MGNLMWHDFARFVSITASLYAVWSGFYGIFFRKFFWDFVGGTLRDPGGLQPSAGAQVFITLIVKNPIIQIFAMVVGSLMVALEYPLPQIKGLAIHRSFALRIVGLLFLSFLCLLYYQGTNAGLWGLIAAGAYTRAQLRGEVMEEAKDNRGKGGRA
ncbi:pro41 protein [Moniliophthora roreri MCA 2997]|uniref:Pro41 protein n=1 Tax=Moniliophthora roreri (strain MCA 2997) TaxID=1381753 RepID=V2XSA4_MONRO|nr:pro41 protein [Moniliophthora roreri MCA 2997]